MAEPTLQEVFGDMSVQGSMSLSIEKSDLASVGLTPSSDNKAESLFVAILLKVRQSLNDANRSLDIQNRNVTVEFSGQDLVDQGAGNVFLRDTFQVSLYRPTTIQSVDPDNY